MRNAIYVGGFSLLLFAACGVDYQGEGVPEPTIEPVKLQADIAVANVYVGETGGENEHLCAEYTTSDGRFYAKNFDASQQADAEAWIAAASSQVVSSTIGSGTCVDWNAKPCNATDQAVCGTSKSQTVSNYASLCEFRKSVRELAGQNNESSGTFTQGNCEQLCATALLAIPAEDNPTFFARNFSNREQAETWLNSTFPNAEHTDVREGTCAAQTDCQESYAPVCGILNADFRSTYFARCNFFAAVMHEAGTDGQSRGYYLAGQCGM